jgi:hypothetical protein
VAAGFKYPGLAFVVFPLGAAAAVFVVARRRELRRALAGLGAFVAAAVVVAAPWYVRGAVWTGNPFYPELYGVFGGRGWSEEQEARWRTAHLSWLEANVRRPTVLRGVPLGRLAEGRPMLRAPLFAPARRGLVWRGFERAYLADPHGEIIVGPAVLAALAFAVFGSAWLIRERGYLFLMAYVLVAFSGWLLATHGVPRFYVPYLAPVVLVGAWGLGRMTGAGAWARWGAGAVVGAAIALGLQAMAVEAWVLAAVAGGGGAGPAGTLPPLAPGEDVTRFLTARGLYPPLWLEAALRNVPPERVGRVLGVGEARTLYLPQSFEAPTVFDRKPLEAFLAEAGGDPEAVVRLAANAGYTHVFANLAELERLQTSYAYDYAGSSHRGYSDTVTAEFLIAMERLGYLRRVDADEDRAVLLWELSAAGEGGRRAREADLDPVGYAP